MDKRWIVIMIKIPSWWSSSAEEKYKKKKLSMEDQSTQQGEMCCLCRY